MSNEDIIKLWNLGLSKNAVINHYIRDYKKKYGKITRTEAMKHVEPILFDYEMQRMRQK